MQGHYTITTARDRASTNTISETVLAKSHSVALGVRQAEADPEHEEDS